MILGRQEETYEFFPTKFFKVGRGGGRGGGGWEGRGLSWTNLCEVNLKVVHWCFDGDVGS